MIDILRKLLPFWFRNFIYIRKQRLEFFGYKKKIVRYYRDHPDMVKDDSMREAIAFLGKNTFSSLPYPFSKSHAEKEVAVLLDKERDLYYGFLDGKRLYFRRGLEVQKIRRQLNCLMLEQDPDSAHRYLTDDFTVNDGDVVIDAGAAEGNFSLSVIEKAGKVILIETSPAWLEALEATFEPWKEKVSVINKFVSNHNSDTTITIDRILDQEGPVDFIKIDVDGEEENLLAASSRLLASPGAPKIALCTYHKDGDPEKFEALLKSNGFSTVFSQGYMIFISQRGLEFPYLRKTILRAWK
ncbi:MAG: FkbM family methyltransferase [Bacteroidota bacterium]